MGEIYSANNDYSHLNGFFQRSHKGKMVVLCGNDGAGKSSQIKLITQYLDSIGKTYKNVHFPMYGDNEFADVITSILKGEFGDINQVDPLFVANMYAMDRYKSKINLMKYLDEYDYLILDRYVFSNMAFQGAKYDDNDKKQGIIKWINDFEFKFLNLPYPDLTIFFDLPIDVIKERLEKNRTGEDRDYLNGSVDIHEKSLDLQTKVREIYLGLIEFPNYQIVNCLDEKGNVMIPNDLFESYKNII